MIAPAPTPAAAASSISVTVRVRPFTIREAAQLAKCDDGPLFLGDGSLAAAPTPRLGQKGIRSVVKVVDDKCLIFDPPEDNPVQRFSRSVVPNGKRVKDQTFGFDRIFDDSTSQGDVYEATTKGLLDSVFDGYNATVFAYGATGCGKTHTITGTAQQPGIIFLTMQDLFEKIVERSEEKVTEVSLSYLEIYNETIRDLLVPGGSKQGLSLREDSHHSVSVCGLSSHHPKNVQEVMDLIMQGNEYRTMSPTEANATSSRSHAVLQINVAQKDRNADVNEPHTMATLSIIDLAGSERASATKNRGERLIEGANINKSLLALGSCINALCDPRKRNHVPYRDSKLTRLLKFSLGGNCRTVMIVCISPSSQHYDETQNTLRYANRAKNIQTKVTRNVYNVNRHVKDYLVKIDEQMTLINELRRREKDYENIAFAKFKKQTEKRDVIVREGIARLRKAYETCAAERHEKIKYMKGLRMIERRIALLSSWISAFDAICDDLENDDPPENFAAMRRTAQGILLELENSRHHYQQRLAKSTWDRAINTALETGLRQLGESDGLNEGSNTSNLAREAELLKSNAEREALTAVSEQDKGGDFATVQVLLKAHFETVMAVSKIVSMSQEEAVEAAKTILSNMLSSCTNAVSYVVKPDGNMAPVEAFPPTRTGTPKRIKQTNIFASPSKLPSLSSITTVATSSTPSTAPRLASPFKTSPKRRKFGGARKGINVTFTPKKRSPSKKRAVRWKDDEEDGAALAEYEKTPQRLTDSPVKPKQFPRRRERATRSLADDSGDSSPISSPPESSLLLNPSSKRFRAGFLLKKTNGSPPPPKMTNLSDSESSPLRDLKPSQVMNRQSPPTRTSLDGFESGSSSSSDNSSGSESETTTKWKANKMEAMKIKTAMKRMSMAHTASSSARAQRRRSPTASTCGSPPGEGIFTTSQARRMGKAEKENEWKNTVLGPRTSPVMKTGRRVFSDGRTSLPARENRINNNHGRASIMPAAKGVWK